MKRTWVDRNLTPEGQFLFVLFAVAFATVAILFMARQCENSRARPCAPATALPSVDVPEAGPAMSLPPESLPVVLDPLAVAIHRIPSTARPSPVEAAHLAGLIRTHCHDLDVWTVAALMRLESGFRADAVSTNKDGSRNLGLLQAHSRYWPGGDPFHPETAVRVGCEKLRRWRSWCKDSHPALVHHFGGTNPPEQATVSVLRVYEFRRKMLAIGGRSAS